MIKGRVRSTSIMLMHYDAVAQEMSIVFQSGAQYIYKSVAVEEYCGLLSAPSIGAAFNAVKEKWAYKRVKGIKVH